jgi:hypothetical protein
MRLGTFPSSCTTGTWTLLSGARTSTSMPDLALSAASLFTNDMRIRSRGKGNQKLSYSRFPSLLSRFHILPLSLSRRLSGWWGHNPTTRFDMPSEFDPSRGAAGFKLSNPDVLSTASLLGSLELFTEAMAGEGFTKLRTKSVNLTAYLESLLVNCGYYVPPDQVDSFEKEDDNNNNSGDGDGTVTANKIGFTIITPLDIEQRGAQLSIVVLPRGKGLMENVFQSLIDQGVLGDERKPDVIRLSPVPLYNTFDDVRRATLSLMEALRYENELLQRHSSSSTQEPPVASSSSSAAAAGPSSKQS